MKGGGAEEGEAYWLPEGHEDLAAEGVEVVCRCGGVDYLPVAVVQLLLLKAGPVQRREHVRVVAAQLQEALQPRGRVLRAHALVTVGQQHDNAALTPPLVLTRADELVNDALCRGEGGNDALCRGAMIHCAGGSGAMMHCAGGQ